MKQLRNDYDAVRQAEKLGYQWADESSDCNTCHHDLISPAFWQALGKARGWGQDEPTDELKLLGFEIMWKGKAHQWFETRLSNGDTQAYWQSLP